MQELAEEYATPSMRAKDKKKEADCKFLDAEASRAVADYDKESPKRDKLLRM